MTTPVTSKPLVSVQRVSLSSDGVGPLTSNAATTFDLEVGADPIVAVIVAKSERAGEGTGDEEGAGDDELGEEHVGGV